MTRASTARPARALSSAKSIRLPDGSRSSSSPWVWRGLFFMSLIALGLCITLVAGNHIAFAACWAVIALGWFAMSMWLWRKTIRG